MIDDKIIKSIGIIPTKKFFQDDFTLSTYCLFLESNSMFPVKHFLF